MWIKRGDAAYDYIYEEPSDFKVSAQEQKAIKDILAKQIYFLKLLSKKCTII